MTAQNEPPRAEPRRWWGDGPAPTFGRADVAHGRGMQREKYAALANYAQHWPPESADGLGSVEYSVCSQNGEDGVLAEILRRLGVRSRTFVEFGVDDGGEGNCVALADHRNWSGWFFEAAADPYRRLAAKYAWNDRVRTARERITPDRVDEIFTAAGVPDAIDVLSVDIDGADVPVWRALSATRARVVVIEYNAAADPAAAVVAAGEWDGSGNFGASLGALLQVADEKGYDLVHLESCGVNAFLVDRAERWDGPTGDDVARRTPNYFMLRSNHPGFDPTLSHFDPLPGPSAGPTVDVRR